MAFFCRRKSKKIGWETGIWVYILSCLFDNPSDIHRFGTCTTLIYVYRYHMEVFVWHIVISVDTVQAYFNKISNAFIRSWSKHGSLLYIEIFLAKNHLFTMLNIFLWFAIWHSILFGTDSQQFIHEKKEERNAFWCIKSFIRDKRKLNWDRKFTKELNGKL